MCRLVQISEHDRLEAVVELLHAAARADNEPVNPYGLHDYLIATDEPEDDVADASEEVSK